VRTRKLSGGAQLRLRLGDIRSGEAVRRSARQFWLGGKVGMSQVSVWPVATWRNSAKGIDNTDMDNES
jgi:hypothetical protein